MPLLELLQNLMWACLKLRFPIAVFFSERSAEFYNITIMNGSISATILCTMWLSQNTQRKCSTLIGLITRTHYITAKGVSFCKAGFRCNGYTTFGQLKLEEKLVSACLQKTPYMHHQEYIMKTTEKFDNEPKHSSLFSTYIHPGVIYILCHFLSAIEMY